MRSARPFEELRRSQDLRRAAKDEEVPVARDDRVEGTGEFRPSDASGAPRGVVGGKIDFVIDFAELIWEPIP